MASAGSPGYGGISGDAAQDGVPEDDPLATVLARQDSGLEEQHVAGDKLTDFATEYKHRAAVSQGPLEVRETYRMPGVLYPWTGEIADKVVPLTHARNLFTTPGSVSHHDAPSHAASRKFTDAAFRFTNAGDGSGRRLGDGGDGGGGGGGGDAHNNNNNNNNTGGGGDDGGGAAANGGKSALHKPTAAHGVHRVGVMGVEYDFTDIVQDDTNDGLDDYTSSTLCGGLVVSSPFRAVILVAILFNTVLVGFQTNEDISREGNALMMSFDKALLTIFSLEILLKWYHGFWAFWKVGWNVFDFLLVFISILGDGLEFLRSGRVLKTFRVLRAFRSFRSISALKGLQVVVQTIVHSLPDMLNILCLLFIVNFIFSVIAVDLFGKSVPQYFGSISDSLFSLFILMTQDGWVQMYDDMRDAGLAASGGVFCLIYIVIGAFIFANLIIGVTVTNLQNEHKSMKESARVSHRRLVNKDRDNVNGGGGGSSGGGGGGGDDADKAIGNAGGKRGRNAAEAAVVSIDDVGADVWSAQTPRQVPDFRVGSSFFIYYFIIFFARILASSLVHFLSKTLAFITNPQTSKH
jgi:uncharacterized membrane protein YgcG